jgi:hypothetical protein
MTRTSPRTDGLVSRLDQALTEPGSKTELARRLATDAGIGLQTAKNKLSRILHRKSNPGSEDTLLLLEWLDGP